MAGYVNQRMSIYIYTFGIHFYPKGQYIAFKLLHFTLLYSYPFLGSMGIKPMT